MKLPVREFDAVVIGAGGAGMRAALQISQSGQTCALLSKVSLAYWQAAHRAFFEREGNWSPEMELVYEEFAVLEIAP